MPIILAADVTPSWVTTIIWAAVLITFLVLFRAPLTKLIGGLAEFSFKANSSGVEASFRRQQAEAAASLAAASASRPSDDTPPDAKAIAETVERSVPRSEAKRFSRATVLWVDDRPDNNTYERRAFEAIGFHFTLAKSTEEALNILKHQKFSAIISDMGRPPDPQAGYTLLDAIRQSGDTTPFVIYAGSNAPQHKRMALERAAQGSTNNPQELFSLVTSAIIEHAEPNRNG
jgi:CheY-like chemotaxis protein